MLHIYFFFNVKWNHSLHVPCMNFPVVEPARSPTRLDKCLISQSPASGAHHPQNNNMHQQPLLAGRPTLANQEVTRMASPRYRSGIDQLQEAVGRPTVPNYARNGQARSSQQVVPPAEVVYKPPPMQGKIIC